MKEPLGPHFFRHEYGRLVAMLARRVGVQHLDAVEDSVQQALLTAVETWPKSAVPENPSAWLYRVAHNQCAGELRRRTRREALARQADDAGPTSSDEPLTAFLAGDVRDDLLRMLFLCCDDAIPIESQLVLALKTLCGFDVREIAERLFTTEANVYKRLGRARNRLREVEFEPDDLATPELAARLPAVQSILYLLFTEGYLSSHAEGPIRRELCDEARRLTEILAEHPVSATPETFALLALMFLHSARLPARQDGTAASCCSRSRIERSGNRTKSGSVCRGSVAPRKAMLFRVTTRKQASLPNIALRRRSPKRAGIESSSATSYSIESRRPPSTRSTALSRWQSGAGRPTGSQCSKGSSRLPGSSARTSGQPFLPTCIDAAGTRTWHSGIATRRSIRRRLRP